MKSIHINGTKYKITQDESVKVGDKCVAQIEGVWRVLTLAKIDWVWRSAVYGFEEYPYYLNTEEHKIHKIIN